MSSLSSLRVGHVYLDVRHGRLHCLNAQAKQLLADGLPFFSRDLERTPLRKPDGAPVTADLMPLLAAWRTGHGVEAHFLWPRDGGLDWDVTWAVSPVRNDAGEVLGVIGSVTCRTPEPDWQLLAELAHDLRTPLQALRMMTAVLDNFSPSDDALRQSMLTARGSADRAIQIGMEMLEWCRGPAQKRRQGQADWLALEPLLNGLVHEQTPAAERKGLRVVANAAAARGWECRADRVKLGRLLANLLVNAVRYTVRGEVRLEAAWQDDDTGGRALALSVADTGPGLTSDEQDSIFQPFERGRAGKESDTSGSGLGLAVVDRLVEELGLTLDVYSEYGHGSRFQLVLPATILREAASSAV